MTTPTSWSSTSPSVVQHMPVKTSGKRSQTVPVRQAKRGNIPEVPALPEPFSASRANSALSSKEVKRSPSRKRTPLSTPAPTPPPRTSSAKQSLSRSSSRSRKPQQLTPPSSEPEGSPVSRRTQKDMDNIADVLPRDSVTRAHGDLQQSLAAQWVQQGQPVMMPWGTDSNRARVWAGRPKDHGIVEHVLDADTRERDLIRSGHQPITPSETVPTVPESPSRLGKLSRLGIFGRRGKSPAKEVERSPRKLQRRGPATGTGHEGYGRYGLRGRKASQETASANNSESERSVSSTRRAPVFSSKGSASRSSSRHHRNSQSDLDEFASNRMKPVPIIGGSGNSLRSESDSRVDVFDRTLQPLGSDLREAMPSPDVSIFGNTADLLDHVHSQEPRPTLAVRRSQRFGKDSETFNIPTSIRTDQISVPLYVTSLDEGRASAVAISTSTPSSTAEYNRGDAGSTRTKDKRTRRLRWNIFRRKETEVESQKTFIPPSASPEEMTVTISTVPAPRSMPYYAMMDSESEVNHNEHVGDFLEQVIESPAISPLMREYEPDYMQTKHAQQGYNEEPYLPPAPTSPPHFFASPLPAVPLPSPHEQPPLQPEQPSQKPPRLPRVGRIPQVVPRAEREHKPSRSSFSQPFARTSAPEIVSDQSADAEPPQTLSFQPRIDILPSTTFSPLGNARPAAAALGEPEFLRFPSRQASERSASSSSEGVLSIIGPPLIPRLHTEEYIARHTRPADASTPQSPTIDDVWNEYDDFIDHVMSPSGTRSVNRFTERQVAGPRPIQGSQANSSLMEALHARSKKANVELSRPEVRGVQRPLVRKPVMTLNSARTIADPPSTPTRLAGEDIRLRRSRIVSALDPVSPLSIRDFLRDYETAQRNSASMADRTSIPAIASSLELLPTTKNTVVMNVGPSHQENVDLLDVVARNKDPVGQSELHYASLMVAKWLSFGRVLFSPAHDEIHTIPERRIIVIDGLGNEDWAIYCAVNYEAQKAFVYDLKEKASKRASNGSRTSPNVAGNHRRTEIASFHERFPFPSAYFCAVVVRFPPAMAEAKMKNIMSECRRILLPGGYLELMLLDLDIVNMGVQTRRAVRELKFRMTTADRQISLRPIIDNVQSMLGARGFSNISRCVVGVPVAGRPSRSTDSSSSSRSSGGSDGFTQPGLGDARQATASPRMAFGQGRKETNLSLNDLIADHSDNADAKISKIVSRTARTWWQHCFEASVISDGNLAKSIFADKNVLGECKSRGSSFKMLIAYAQRPVFEGRRRTMSESAVATLATAGAHRQAQASSSASHTA
ncbi:hypothetical protein LTR47_004517 [Exophiala xenobiotica]|nr:hypothetical protein LTR47_004517 [Exophiala xenobiotica]KAK5249828.1 hypothetical protein LTS06_005324 [Exophiala xenobiotica]KAK5352156.1 hypothetical protein LTR61_004406 [Exophiala xenobiotica]KAK5369088.1 hypothetical protein LTR11_007460 [Exophiala xenobiotica]KAK5381084.1 hypothetical protein LTS03_003923 [Exophiala xenobiotica]